MSALHGAVALTEMHAHTVAIAEHLHLDVTRLLDVLLAIDFRRAERCASLRLTGGERLCGDGALAHDSHAAAAATGRRLEHDGIAGLVGDLERVRLTLERQIGWSARRTGNGCASAVECASTVRMPISRHVRMMRSAIAPRLAIRILWDARLAT